MTENKMTDREKLIELLYKPFIQYKINKLSDTADIADHLLSHGVTFEKQGEWVPVIDEPNYTLKMPMLVGYKCSVCGRYEEEREPYCNCGAKMKGENR